MDVKSPPAKNQHRISKSTIFSLSDAEMYGKIISVLVYPRFTSIQPGGMRYWVLCIMVIIIGLSSKHKVQCELIRPH